MPHFSNATHDGENGDVDAPVAHLCDTLLFNSSHWPLDIDDGKLAEVAGVGTEKYVKMSGSVINPSTICASGSEESRWPANLTVFPISELLLAKAGLDFINDKRREGEWPTVSIPFLRVITSQHNRTVAFADPTCTANWKLRRSSYSLDDPLSLHRRSQLFSIRCFSGHRLNQFAGSWKTNAQELWMPGGLLGWLTEVSQQHRPTQDADELVLRRQLSSRDQTCPKPAGSALPAWPRFNT
ncbi:hypothetical protein VTI74DRAFT_1035 [Chaetomium olivicolor]